jgi:hypothetical protein
MSENLKQIPNDPRSAENEDGDVVPLESLDYFNEETDSDPYSDEPDTEPVEGASVSLKDRAEALDIISKQMSQDAQLKGAYQQANIKDSDFRKRYQNPEGVVSDMQHKQTQLRRMSSKAMDTLMAKDSLLEAGFEEGDVESTNDLESMSTRHDLRNLGANGRRKLMTRLRKQAK